MALKVVRDRPPCQGPGPSAMGRGDGDERAAAGPRDNQPRADDSAREIVNRHRLSTRIWHWVNALTVFVMLMSGLMIFNAHPRLYWGAIWRQRRPCLAGDRLDARRGLSAGRRADRPDHRRARPLDRRRRQRVDRRAFPRLGDHPLHLQSRRRRRWHLAFAWVLAIGAHRLLDHVPRQPPLAAALCPAAPSSRPRHFWREVRRPCPAALPHRGGGARATTSLQKLSYVGVIFLLLPVVILTGLTMSPGMNAAWPWLLDMFGGRQSARSIHFICAFLLRRCFILVHLIMVVLAGPLNEIRSMITGWYRRARSEARRQERKRSHDPPAAPCSLGGAGALLAGCDRLNNSAAFRDVLRSSEGLEHGRATADHQPRRRWPANSAGGHVAGLPLQRHGDARTRPNIDRLAAGRFADWRLHGRRSGPAPAFAVARPDPARCRGGPRSPATIASRAGRRSASGPGCRSSLLLDQAGLQHEARYIVFHCMDRFGDRPYYESIDLIDAFHPQTILAWALNDRLLPDPQRRAAAAPGRAPARLQARQISDADRGP